MQSGRRANEIAFAERLTLLYTRSVVGMAEINATSRRDCFTLTPICHSLQWRVSGTALHRAAPRCILAPPGRHQRPAEELARVVEAEHVVVVLHIVLAQKLVQLRHCHASEHEITKPHETHE